MTDLNIPHIAEGRKKYGSRKRITLEVVDGRIRLPWPEWRNIEISPEGIHTPRGLLRPHEIAEMLWKAKLHDRYGDNDDLAMDVTPQGPAVPQATRELEKTVLFRHRPKKKLETHDQLEAYMESIKHLAFNTRESYRNCISALLEYSEQEGITSWDGLTRKKIQNYLEQKGIGKHRRVNYLSSINRFYKFLIKTGVVTKNPAEGLK